MPHKQPIAAHPWQDPFAAIEKAFDKTDKRNLERQCLKTLISSNAQESPLTEKEHETLVIGVMVPGAAYSEDAEHRRWTRFAVFAASHVWGSYRKIRATLNISHGHTLPGTSALPFSLDYQAGPAWEKGTGIAQPQQTMIPYEWFEEVTRRIRGDEKQILILWLNEDVFRGEPLRITISSSSARIHQPRFVTW